MMKEIDSTNNYIDSLVDSLPFHNHQTLKQIRDGDNIILLLSEVPDIVPHQTKFSEVLRFYNRYGETLPIGEQVQTLLSIRYTEESFEAEVQRLTSIDGIVIDQQHFLYPAFVTALSWNNCSEYVLVDKDNYELHYVFLQNVKAEDVRFSLSFLPLGYSDYGIVENVAFCIYEDAYVNATS